MKKIILFLAISFLITSCSIKQVVEQAEIPQEVELCIIENPAVREGFLEEFKLVLSEKKIPYKIVSESAVPSDCEWTTTYTGLWTWDMALYMSYAEIKVFHNGSLDGQAIYDSTMGGANMGKFIDAKTKIRELVNELMQYKSSALFKVIYS